MIEKVTTYFLPNLEDAMPMDRNEFYAEQKKFLLVEGKVNRAVEVVALLLFNSEGQFILQKRSHEKMHNPYLLDKAIGGHIRWGESPTYTVMVETVQELRVPSIVLRSEDDFNKTYVLLQSYLDSIAIVEELDKALFFFDRQTAEGTFRLAHKVHLYIGVYGGSTRPVDKEASGVLYYDFNILKKEMNARSDTFTHDLHVYLETYEKEIDSFLQKIR